MQIKFSSIYLTTILFHCSCVFPVLLSAQTTEKPLYPIVFVHGLVGDDSSFEQTLQILENDFHWGPIYVFDAILNSDDASSTASMANDVRFDDFFYKGDFINVGRRNYGNDPNSFQDEWIDASSRLFVMNFAEERIRGAAGGFFGNDHFDGSNEAAISKQAYALKIMIENVLEFTGESKVVLVGHSMGGLVIREYLQRLENNHPNPYHKWWIAPSAVGGHRVAKVVTIGTPHLGSNFLAWPLKSGPVPNPFSEAVRDLRYQYQTIGLDLPGVFLYGGSEAEVKQHELYCNADFNCDGDETDSIIGINDRVKQATDNQSMPLPLDIQYTWITAVWNQSSDQSDGVVLLDRQWLHESSTPVPIGCSDTLFTNRNHLDECSDYFSILRGLDEPGLFGTAYEIKFNKTITGLISHGMDFSSNDSDCFMITVETPGQIQVRLENPFLCLNKLEIFNSEGLKIAETPISSSYLMNFFPITNSGIYFLKLSGIATSSIKNSKYTFRTEFIQNHFSPNFTVTAVYGEAPLTVQFSDVSTGQPSQWAWDFNNDGIIESTTQNPTYTFQNPGDYTISLLVSNGNVFQTITKTNLIHVDSLGASTPLITHLEYFFDRDPGLGHGFPVSVLATNELSLNTNLNIAYLSEGVHTLYFRVKDSRNCWSLLSHSTFYKRNVDENLPVLKKLEYFLDNDPGLGNGSQIALSSNNNIWRNIAINLSTVSDGLHTLNIRPMDARKSWGFSTKSLIYVERKVKTTPKIKKIQFIILDSLNTAVSNIIDVTNFIQSVDLNFSFRANIPNLSLNKKYIISTWVVDENEKISYRQNDTFRVTDPVKVELTILIEGLLQSTRMQSDSITIRLHESTMPYTVLESTNTVLDSMGKCSIAFNNISDGCYYLSTQHRSTLETWSKAGGIQLKSSHTTTYNFSSDSSQAFGNNLKRINNKWFIYSGDINQDGIINLADLLLVYDRALSFTSGYHPLDINADGIVDLSDILLCDNNAYQRIVSKRP